MYQYDTLPDGCFRLLKSRREPDDRTTLSYSLMTFKFVEAPAYFALSYTWGAPEPAMNIELEGKAFKVRENLFSYFCAMITYGPPKEFKDDCPNYIWIDAICIDQNSDSERSVQVAIMGEIFSKAKFVVAWLGEPADHSDNEVMDIFETFNYSHSPLQKRFVNLPRELGEGFPVLRHAYWNRLWIVQEVLLAQHLIVMCGHRTCHWENFRAAVSGHSQALSWARPLTELAIMWNLYQPQRQLGVDNLLSSSPLPHPFHFMKEVTERKCVDPRDRVYGILGLGNIGKVAPLQPDYGLTNREVFEQVIRYINVTVTDPQRIHNDLKLLFSKDLASGLELQRSSLSASPHLRAFFRHNERLMNAFTS